MKDVGLDDLDGYNNSNESSNAGIVTTLNNSSVLQQNTANNSNVLQQNTTTIISSQGQAIMQSTPTLMTTTAGNQILVQNQPQQIQVQVLNKLANHPPPGGFVRPSGVGRVEASWKVYFFFPAVMYLLRDNL